MNLKKCFYSVISKSILLFSLISILIFSSCEVGLGESVDTENPSVEITYPPNGSVIRGSFTFAGVCADDKGVSKVSVTVRKNDDASFVKEYEAKILDGGKWTCVLNEVQDGKAPTALQEKVFPFADGKYEIKAVAIDSSNRQSDGISRTYEIDNTPPVFIISSPVVTDTENATEYGSIFKISGKIADDHAPLSSMKVSVFDQDGNTITGNEIWTFSKVDISGGTTVNAARYFTKENLSPEEEILYKNYINIYGENTEGDKVFTCTIEIEDSAKEWNEPNFDSKKEVVNTTEGNKTTKLYLNDSIYSLLMGADSEYQLEAGGIKDILNGTTKNDTVLSILNKEIIDTKETKLAFSLNKKANPIYSINGYDVKELNFASNSGSKNQTVTFQVQAGLNGTSVSPETFKLYLFGPFEKNALTQDEIQKIYDNPEASSKTYSEKYSVIFDGTSYSKGSVATFTQAVSLPEAISSGQVYIFAASGKDLDNLDLQTSNDTVYGFQGISAGTPPKVYISEPASDGLVIKENSSLVIKGIAESAESKIASVKYEIVVYNTLKSDENGKFIKVGEISGNAVSDSGFGLPFVSYSCSVKDGIVNLEDGYTSVNPGDGEIFSYAIKVTVQDDSNTESFIERNIYLDNAKPVPVITNVDPVAEKKLDESGNVSEKKINGTVTVSGKVSEKNLKSLVLTVKDKDGKTETHTYSEASFEEPIDTTLLPDGKITISLEAIDEAGNTSVIKEDYIVDQSTDKPVIKFSNGKDSIKDFSEVNKIQNTFGVETNNKAVFNFTDDDGLEKVTITLLDKDGKTVDASVAENYVQVQENQTGEDLKPINPVVYTFDGSTTALVNYILPKKEGMYILEVEAFDVEYKKASGREDADKVKNYRTSVTKNYIAVSDSNFNIKFDSANIINDECSTQKVDTTITGIVTVSDVKKIKSIKRYEITQNDKGEWVLGSLVSSYTNDATEENPNTITITKDGSSSYVQWQEIVPKDKMQEGVKNFRYIATDTTDVSVSIDLKWNVDDTLPELHKNAYTENIADKWLNSTSQTLIYIVRDKESNGYASGIDSVKYSFKNGENPTEGYFARGASCDENGDEKAVTKEWTLYKTTFDLPEEKSTSVTVTVSDKVGNKKTDSINFKIDTNVPTVSDTPSIPGEQVLQNSKTIPVTFGYTDATSGIQCIEFSTDSSMKNNLVTLTGNEIVSPYEYSLSGLLDGTYTIYVRATDNAGNKTSSQSAGSVTVDNTPPTVEIKTPVSGAIVNKTIDFTGTVTDNNLSKSAEPVLQYNDGTSWKKVSAASTSLINQEWTITGVDTTKLNKETSEQSFKFRVVFTDKAENANGSVGEYSLKIDQNADRPEIKLTNINITGSSISSNIVQGLISDDDGVSTKDGDYAKIKLYRINSADYDADSATNKTPSTIGNKWKNVPVEAGTGIWKATIDKDSEGEGSKHWYFYVIDEAGGEFCTKSTSQLERPYLTEGSNPKTDNQTGITFFFDTTAPTVKISVSEDGKNYSTTNTIFGGSKQLYVRAEVTEAVGMKTTEPAVLYIGGVKQGENTPTVIQNGNTYTYTFNPIELSGYPADKPLSVSVIAEDSAGNTNKDILNITIDKDAPTVKIISPTTSLSDAVSSSVSIKGIVQDDKSSIAKLEYVIPKTGVQDSSQEWKAMGTSASWDITFASGAPDSSDSLIYYAVAENSGAKVYQVADSGTENIYKVPVWFRVSDSAGNEQIVKDQYVLVDSEGGKPKAWINSPEEDATTSGVVTIYGGASDNVSVSKVCVQLDANNDGIFDANDATYIKNSWTSSNDELKSTIVGSDSNWYIPASGTNSWKLNVDTGCIPERNGSKSLRIRVKAIDEEDRSRQWSDPVTVKIDSETPVIKNLKLVQYGKDVVTPTDSTQAVTEREYVSGMYISNISVQNNGKWYLTGEVSDNQTVSSITFEMITSSTQNNIRLEDEKEIKPNAVSYKLRVPLKTDESGVISYAIKAKDNNTGEATVSITINIDSTSPSLYNTGNTETLNPGTNLRLKSMSKMLGTESDNSTVVNNNNYFTFGDVVSEAGSGLLYTAFYFERDGSTEKRVYNPMFKNSNNTVIDSNSFENGKVYINSDGLASLCISNAIRPSEDSITLSSENKSIRKGGLIKIAGGYSLITEVSGTTVKFSPTASTTFTQAELILAQVVDHKITESVDSLDGKTVVNDDGDGMIETINQIGSSYNWTASIDSNNIPDGPVTIHVVAIDNAGNSTHGSIATKVENNRPRIAKVLLGTDLNGNGKYDFNASSESQIVTSVDETKATANATAFGEFSYYSAINPVSGVSQSDVELVSRGVSSGFKVISGLAIVPEFVGGNGNIGYVLKETDSTDDAEYKNVQKGSPVALMTRENLIAETTNKGGYALSNQVSEKGGLIITPKKSNIALTFWDSTDETIYGQTSQWAHLMIPVILMTAETNKPKPKIAPFYWNESKDNSVYINKAIAGHIELEDDLAGGKWSKIQDVFGDTEALKKPKVSGKVKVQGTVYDDVRLSAITANVFGTEFELSTYTSGSWSEYTAESNALVESFTVNSDEISQKGHTVTYTMVVNTEKLNTVTGLDKVITISAKDWKNNDSVSSSTQTTVSSNTNYYKMDIVPYVTEIVTNLSSYSMDNPSVYARSSVGSYPVYEGEEIEIKGYNIGQGIASVAMNGKTVTLNSSNKLTVDSNVSSGTVSVSVNSIPAVNNINKNNAVGSYSGSASDKDYANCYNRQPNGVNNNLLTDDLSLDVWNFKTAASPIGSSANYVHMKVGPYLSSDNPNSGRIGFSFKNAIGYFNMPGQKSGNVGSITGKVDLYIATSCGKAYGRMWDSGGSAYYYGDSSHKPTSLGTADSSGYYVISLSSVNFSSGHKLGIILSEKEGKWDNQTGNMYVEAPGKYYIGVNPNSSLPANNNSSTLTASETYENNNNGSTSEVKVYSQTRFGSNYGGFNHNTFAFDKNGYTYGAAQAPDTSGQSGMSANFQFFSRAVSDESNDFHGLNFNYYNATNARRIENTSYYKSSTVYTDENRVQNPEMATYVKDSTSYVYLAYYDHGLDMIKFRVGSVGSSANSIGLGLQDLDGSTSYRKSGKTGTITNDNGGEGDDKDKIAVSNNNLRDSLDTTYKGDQGNAYQYVTNIADSGASPYVAVGALPTDGTAVVVWYDKNVQALKMKSAAFDSVTSTSVSWTDRGTISSVGGKYVSMAIDEAGGIHLAYLSNSGANLYYTYMSSVSATPITMLVDAYQDVGDRCMITVGRESTSKPWIPYISYKSNYASHTKIAYPVFADNADAATMPTSGIENGTEKYTGAWNVSLVPDTSLSIDDTVSIGVNKDWANGEMHVFPTGDTQTASDIGAYALCNATIVYGNGTKNPVMGYAIEDGSIQMAQKK